MSMRFPQQLGLSILDDLVGDGCLRIPRHSDPHGRSWKNAMKSSTSWGFTRSTTSTGAAEESGTDFLGSRDWFKGLKGWF